MQHTPPTAEEIALEAMKAYNGGECSTGTPWCQNNPHPILDPKPCFCDSISKRIVAALRAAGLLPSDTPPSTEALTVSVTFTAEEAAVVAHWTWPDTAHIQGQVSQDAAVKVRAAVAAAQPKDTESEHA